MYSLFVDRVDGIAAERRSKVVKNALEVTHEEPHVSVSKIKSATSLCSSRRLKLRTYGFEFDSRMGAGIRTINMGTPSGASEEEGHKGTGGFLARVQHCFGTIATELTACTQGRWIEYYYLTSDLAFRDSARVDIHSEIDLDWIGWDRWREYDMPRA